MKKLLLIIGAQILLTSLVWGQTTSLPETPEVRAKNHVASFTLHAVMKMAAMPSPFDGEAVAPVVCISPGDNSQHRLRK